MCHDIKKRLKIAALADYHLSLMDGILADFHFDVIWTPLLGSGALGWGARCGVETSHS